MNRLAYVYEDPSYEDYLEHTDAVLCEEEFDPYATSNS